MPTRLVLAAALALLALFAIVATLSASAAPTASARFAQPEDLRALDGVWIYIEDRTEGRPTEEHQPSMSSKVTLRVEEDAVVLVRSRSEIRMPLDGSPTDVTTEGSTSHYSGKWTDGAFAYESVPAPGSASTTVIRWELRPTPDGLLASVATDTGWKSVALYRHPQDIALPTPAAATINDMAWLAGAWVGTRGTDGAISIEERWSPPLGGAMLAVSRTVARGSMRGFEFLRMVERDGGLVYIAQPNGAPPTEFVLTELAITESGTHRAVFENPRHDSPQRIIYELSTEGRLTASIGNTNGGRPRAFEYGPEGR